MWGWGCATDPELNLGLGLLRSLLEANLKMESHHLLFVEMENTTNRDWEGKLFSSTELQKDEQNMFNMRVFE